ncbi:hypothetical protein VK792_10845 [Mesobacterium sp. TK19101]|uniref:Lipoprotein n=1 Tax=Mesobacterium hydrothermale TaxID=3111907 RepID=A0ABU6HH47_9RHOB|nr:hypothetical protein [Mesobacterium sp. TK19101]MEC3861783.1 hypothetical protein [Mesobacterium sp. TK19101]
MKTHVLAACTLLAGCGYFDSDTIERLTNVSPLEADPGQYEVVVTLPEGLDIPRGGAVLNVTAQRPDTHASSSGRYVLQRRETTEGALLFRVAPGDLPQLKAQQALIRDWEAETGGATTGTFGVDVDACRKGDGPDLNGLMSISLIEGTGTAPRVLVPPTPVRQVVITGGDNQVILPPCGL